MSTDSPEIVEGPTDDVLELPDRLPVLPTKGLVVFPQSITPLIVGEERSVRLIDDVMNREDRLLALVAARDPEAEKPGPDDIYTVGTAARVQRMVKVPDGTVRVLVEGLDRIRVGPYEQSDPFLEARVEKLPDVVDASTELEALARNLQTIFGRVIELVPYLPDELHVAAANVDDPAMLSYLIASALRLPLEERQELLELTDVRERLRRLTVIVNREVEVLELGAKIQSDVQSDMEQTQREHFLRQQLRAIQEELGESDEGQAEVNELRTQIEDADPPPDVREVLERELGRLERLPQGAAEHSVIRTYIDWILSIPWGTRTDDDLDLDRARAILDEDHYDIEKVKERIIEHLAVVRLNPDAPAPILCFSGPPGVGKTSLGQSIARALGREFARISVGGVRDESEIRGHRRTYVGAMPGTIVRAIRDAEAMNPVMMIDEIDKMGSDFRGDPASAMLEVLDPAQNDTFRDHYLDLPLDLSGVLFICTANVLETIPTPLLDRMEVIPLAGYTDEEKLHIARRFLLPRQREQAGLSEDQLGLTDGGLRVVIGEYTREAGVRQLERRLGAVARKVARQVADGGDGDTGIDEDAVRELLGPERVYNEVKRRTAEAGVATGLAVTGAGGEILFVEASVMPGSGKLVVTGQLGDVMKESAQAAMSYVRSHANELGLSLPDDYFLQHDVHLHIPAGAIPKDGPSAGVTLTTALVSALSDRPVDSNVAMTGEITLTGLVLPVGGVKEKVLAARRAGIGTVIIPTLTKDQLAEVDEELLADTTIVHADRLHEVLAVALNGDAQETD